MSGIVGSYFNTRGSGVVAKLGADGQVFTSTGAGLSQGFEAAAGGGSWNLIKTLTSDGSDSDFQFVNGADDVVFDGTYLVYQFIWQSIHPETDTAIFGFQVSDDAGSSYGIAATQSSERFYNKDAAANNQNIGTGTVGTAGTTDELNFNSHPGADADQSQSGWMNFYNPADTTFSKMWEGSCANYTSNDYINHHLVAGIIIPTAAVDAIRFQFSTGEIQAGTISMYGLTT
jgi:hypothetical protein|tara:strand:+ start:25 stop:714 length:690 start_codon:yes stop_codon:yes gene_type:complete